MSLLAGASGFSFASWRPGFYPPGTRTEDFLRFYSGRAVDGRGQLDLLPPAEPRDVPALGGHRARGLSLRGQDAARDHGLRPRRRRTRLLRARARPRRPARPAARAPADDRKRDDGFLRALLDGIDDDLWAAFDLRDPSWDGVEELLEGRDAVRVNQLDAPAPFRYLRLREPPYDDAALAARGPIGCARCSTTALAVHCYFRHEDEPTAPAYARGAGASAGGCPRRARLARGIARA